MTGVPQPPAEDPQVTADPVARESEDAVAVNHDESAVPQRTLRLWEEVAHGIDKNSTGGFWFLLNL
jgi:hypothetical protein